MRKKHGNVDFIAKRKMFWLLSLTVMTVGIIANLLIGTRLDMRFTGGTVLRYSYVERERVQASDSDVASAADAVISEADVSETDIDTDARGDEFSTQDAAQMIFDTLGVRVSVVLNEHVENDEKTLVVTFADGESLGHNAEAQIRRVLSSRYPDVQLRLTESNSYDALIGREFFGKCLVAIILAAFLMLVFVAIRFHSSCGMSVGFCGMIAVLHDVAVVYFAFVILRFPIDNNFIAAVLAVIGYSLNSTIVVFDRIRQNRKLFGSRLDDAQLANMSMNEMLTRTVSTNMCILAALGILAIISAVSSIESTLRFSVPMMFGVISGCYSSLFIATTLWVSWCKIKAKLFGGRKTGESAEQK